MQLAKVKMPSNYILLYFLLTYILLEYLNN